MAILVFQHSDVLDTGRLAVTLRDHGFRLDVRRSDLGDPVPTDFDDVDGLVVLGGGQNVPDGHAWLDRECAFIRGAHERSLPVMGICLGAQMIAHTFGGEVGPMNTPEIGVCEVSLTTGGQNDTMFAGVPWSFPIFQKHKQEVRKLPEGAHLLASSSACKHQAFRLGMRTYAFQFHFEYDKTTMLESTRNMASELSQCGLSHETLAKNVDTHYEQIARLSNRLCVNIATFLIPRRAGEMLV